MCTGSTMHSIWPTLYLNICTFRRLHRYNWSFCTLLPKRNACVIHLSVPVDPGSLTLTQGHVNVNDTWCQVHWYTLFPKRNATFKSVDFLWGRVYHLIFKLVTLTLILGPKKTHKRTNAHSWFGVLFDPTVQSLTVLVKRRRPHSSWLIT